MELHSCEAIKGCEVTIQSTLPLTISIWYLEDHRGPNRTKGDHMGPYRIIRDHTGKYSTIRDHMGSYGSIRDNTRP